MQNIELTDRIAIVTGAARGIGEHVARHFHGHGAKVLITDVLDDLGQAVAEDLGDAAAFFHLDVSAEGRWVDAFAVCEKALGRADILTPRKILPGEK